MTKGLYIRTAEIRKKLSNSRKAMGIVPWNKGKKHTEETKRKIAETAKGNKKRLGIKHTDYTKRKISISNGSKKGWVTPINKRIRQSLEYKRWRTSVFIRDNRTCILCGYTGQNINADHIKPFAYFPELRFAIDNGRTLCIPCHKLTDTYGSKCHNYKLTKKS